MSSALYPSFYRSQESGKGVTNVTLLVSGNANPCQSRQPQATPARVGSSWTKADRESSKVVPLQKGHDTYLGI